MRRENNYDHLVKLLIIGDSGVGKTNILLRFCENSFLASHLTTIGIDFKIKTVEVENKKIRLQVWDTAGQQRFKTITQTYYKGSMGIIMTYSVNDEKSFGSIQNWMRQIKTHVSDEVIKILVGNKCDAADRKVTYEAGKKVAMQYGVEFFEVSAKEGLNIDEIFMHMATQIKHHVLSRQEPIRGTTANKIKQRSQKKKRNCC